MMTARRYTVRSLDDATGLPAEGLEEMAAPSPSADVNAWLAEQHTTALAHREQCVAALAALRAQIADVEAQVVRLDRIIHGRGWVSPTHQRSRHGTLIGKLLAHLRSHPREHRDDIATAVYGRSDEKTKGFVSTMLSRLEKQGAVRHVGVGQWEVV